MLFNYLLISDLSDILTSQDTYSLSSNNDSYTFSTTSKKTVVAKLYNSDGVIRDTLMLPIISVGTSKQTYSLSWMTSTNAYMSANIRLIRTSSSLTVTLLSHTESNQTFDRVSVGVC